MWIPILGLLVIGKISAPSLLEAHNILWAPALHFSLFVTLHHMLLTSDWLKNLKVTGSLSDAHQARDFSCHWCVMSECCFSTVQQISTCIEGSQHNQICLISAQFQTARLCVCVCEWKWERRGRERVIACQGELPVVTWLISVTFLSLALKSYYSSSRPYNNSIEDRFIRAVQWKLA